MIYRIHFVTVLPIEIVFLRRTILHWATAEPFPSARYDLLGRLDAVIAQVAQLQFLIYRPFHWCILIFNKHDILQLSIFIGKLRMNFKLLPCELCPSQMVRPTPSDSPLVL